MKAFQKIHSQEGQFTPSFILLVVFFFVLLTFNITHIAAGHFAVVFLAFIVFVLAFVKTDFAIGILIFSMLLSPELTVGQAAERAVVLRLDDIFLFVILLGWLAKLAIHKEMKLLKQTSLDLPIKLYLTVCAVSTAINLVSKQQDLARSFFYLMKYSEYFVLYFLVVHNLRNKRQAEIFVSLMVLTALLVSVYALYAYRTAGIRATAPFEGKEGEPNTLAGYLVILMAVMLGLFCHLENLRVKAVLLGVLFVVFLAFLFTLSRGGWLAFLFMYPAFVFFSKRAKGPLILGLILLMAFLPFAAPSAVKARFSTTFRPSRGSQTFHVIGRKMTLDASGSARVRSLSFGLRQLLKSPIIGNGVPTYALVDTQYTRVMMETGIIGLLAFFFLLRRIFQSARRALAYAPEDKFVQGLTRGYLAGFVGLLIHSFSAASFIIVRIMEPFWFLTAIVVSLPFLVRPAGTDAGPPGTEGT